MYIISIVLPCIVNTTLRAVVCSLGECVHSNSSGSHLFVCIQESSIFFGISVLHAYTSSKYVLPGEQFRCVVGDHLWRLLEEIVDAWVRVQVQDEPIVAWIIWVLASTVYDVVCKLQVLIPAVQGH